MQDLGQFGLCPAVVFRYADVDEVTVAGKSVDTCLVEVLRQKIGFKRKLFRHWET